LHIIINIAHNIPSTYARKSSQPRRYLANLKKSG